MSLVQAQTDQVPPIPSKLSEFVSIWEVTESTDIPSWDFMWSAISDESKEKQMTNDAFVTYKNSPFEQECSSAEHIKLAEAALKVECFKAF